MSDERTVWTGTPSQVINLGVFIVCGLLFWLIVPLFIIVWKWLVTWSTRYELTTERLKTRVGVINKKMDELELYRVRDYKLEQPLMLRLFSLGNLILQTSDRSNPVVMLRAVPDAEQLREQIRALVEECRRQKGVREVDVE
ncbi:MAG: PH domain-containing protein [Gammaproteobacteria bacterium]